MSKILNKVINKGVPVETPVLLELTDIFEIFHDNQKLKLEIRREMLKLVNYISNIIETDAGRIFYSSYIVIHTNEDHTKELSFSQENYYGTIYTLLGINSDADYRDAVGEMLSRLKRIQSEKRLERKFPYLYRNYSKEIENCHKVLKLDKILNNENIPVLEKFQLRKNYITKMEEFYPNYNLEKEIEYAKEFHITTYIEKQVKIIETLIEKEDEILDFLQKTKVNLSCLSKKEEEKLELYVVYAFMEELERATDNDKQRYLYYLTNYFKNKKDDNLEISVNQQRITVHSLYEKYKKILVEYPYLLTVTFKENEFDNMTTSEVEEFMREFLKELSANWDFLPKNDEEFDKDVIHHIKGVTRTYSVEEKEFKRQKLIDLYIEKKNFYDETDPYYRVKGKNTFDGYVGFIYSNGIVILDKFYHNIHKSTLADGEAIYVMSMKEFYELSKHSKSYLIENRLCKRIIHKGEWQDRVREEIMKEHDSDVVEETKKLIRKKYIQ